jgi:dipeptidase D
MSKIIDHFQTLSKIPHCSQDARRLLRFLMQFAQERGYHVEVDSYGNLLISKGTPTLCLQAHYDMVCMGKAPMIEMVIEDQVMRAKESSLGADNGMAIAMMMALMDQGVALEFLFTADEEIGLIGANGLSFELQSDFMLNLDSEEEGEVYIGCAGGVDIVASIHNEYQEGEGACYEVSVRGLAGGHSGVDIDKDIPSAIKLLARYLKSHGVVQLCSLYGGERRNAIPANAVAIVRSATPLVAKKEVGVRLLSEQPKALQGGEKIIEMLDHFEHGVEAWSEQFSIPHSSINLAIVETDEQGGLSVQMSARAMDMESLEELGQRRMAFLSSYGFKSVLEDKYPAWSPQINDFSHLVEGEMIKVFGKSRFMAIHAGLECGVIAKRYPTIKFASIGPTIRYPHSTREEVDLESVEKIYGVLEGVVAHYT